MADKFTTITIFGTDVDLGTATETKSNLDAMVIATTAVKMDLDIAILDSLKEMTVTELLSANNRLRTIKTFRDKIVIEEIYKPYPDSTVSSEFFTSIESSSGANVLKKDYHFIYFGTDIKVRPRISAVPTTCIAIALFTISQSKNLEFGFYINTFEFKSEFLTY